MSGDPDGSLGLSQPLLGSGGAASARGMPGGLGGLGRGVKLSKVSAAGDREALEEPGVNGASPRSALGSQASDRCMSWGLQAPVILRD